MFQWAEQQTAALEEVLKKIQHQVTPGLPQVIFLVHKECDNELFEHDNGNELWEIPLAFQFLGGALLGWFLVT